MKNDLQFLSKDGVTVIHAAEWVPSGKPVGILQICHGMVEYIERYHEFAQFLAERNYYVTGHDHLGHGRSVETHKDHGYFHESQGNTFLIEDIHYLRTETQKKYPDVPYFMLGHSMGSFLLRQYLHTYGRGLSGAVIMGTGYKNSVVLAFGMGMCKVIAAFRGWRHRSWVMNKLGLGGYNRKFEPGESSKDWVTSDREKRSEYLQDPFCSFVFTVGGYYQLFSGMRTLVRKNNLERMDKALPILFASGKDDPVGDFGRGVKKVFGQFKKIGIQNLSMKLYDKDRHEILNETDRQQVYEDIYLWLQSQI